MQLKLTSLSSVAQSFILVAACVAAPSVAMADFGGVLAWGYNDLGQCTIPDSANSGVTAIASGSYHTIALKDGAVLAWGWNDYGQCTIPDSANSGVTAIAGGTYQTIALTRDAASYQAEIATLTSLNAALTAQLNCGDLNGDGEAGSADIGFLLMGFGQCNITASANSGVSAITRGGGLHTIALTRDAASYQAEIATLTSQNAALTAQLNCGDLDGDGEAGSADLSLLLMGYGQCPQP